MHVKIGTVVFDSGKVPIGIVLTDMDRQQIAAMPPGTHMFCAYPSDKFTPDEIQQWMNAPADAAITPPEQS